MPKNFTSLPPVSSPRRGAPSPRAPTSARRGGAPAPSPRFKSKQDTTSTLSALKDEDPSLRGLVEAEAVRELAGNLAGDGAAWLSRAVHRDVGAIR